MVTIALASLIIGESLIGRGGMLIRILGVIFGSCLYRFFVALALRMNIPAESLKLVPQGARDDHPSIRNAESKAAVLRAWTGEQAGKN